MSNPAFAAAASTIMRGSICRHSSRAFSLASESSLRPLLSHLVIANSSPSSSSTSIVRRIPTSRFLASTSHALQNNRSPTRQSYAGRNPSSSSSSEDGGEDRPRLFTTQRDIDRSGRDRPPRDHEITDPQIMVIDNGVAEGPLSTPYVLTKLEPEESLRMIQPYIPADAKEGTKASLAVCKIVNKRDEYERQKLLKERKKTAAAAKPKTKELEITWAISDNDLGVKMDRLRAFLEKGMKVEMTIGRKKGGRRVTAEEAEEVLKRVRKEMEELGGREGKTATGEVGGTMRLHFEGTARK